MRDAKDIIAGLPQERQDKIQAELSHGERIKADILRMGLQLWRVDAQMVSARRIGHELGLTHSAVLYHYGSTLGLKNAIADHAVKTGDSKIIVQLIAQQHDAIAAMSDDDRARHMRAVR